ncbi:DUF7109 family protein [Halegenticoccus tardaugens]|uniref:DUF7109 family protein n=1 Tax=Halegenticoccus tardaugens TaxID=2071624 RepID=UPI001E4A313D|nr:hypothetical protein [Halegenticoccus tardaugens]
MRGEDDAASELPDELAGVVDLFGALTRTELERALSELAFKQGKGADAEALSAAVEEAVEGYYLVEYEAGGSAEGDGGESVRATGDDADEPLLTPGPVAFPTLPENAEDLPHIMDVEPRRIDREALGRQVGERLLGDAARAVAAGDGERIERLLDVSYDLEAWAPVDVREARDRLGEALGGDRLGETPEDDRPDDAPGVVRTTEALEDKGVER